MQRLKEDSGTDPDGPKCRLKANMANTILLPSFSRSRLLDSLPSKPGYEELEEMFDNSEPKRKSTGEGIAGMFAGLQRFLQVYSKG
mmetsp:Transcript_23135/g.92501  ORF Transcript_23135/g.92501 Transcript_23135/m.92501 type:complete len:86 (+) Transcript_23135:972-1229(+)